MRIRFNDKTRRGIRHTYQVMPDDPRIVWCPRLKKWMEPARGHSLRTARICKTAHAAFAAAAALIDNGHSVSVVRSGRTPFKMWTGRP